MKKLLFITVFLFTLTVVDAQNSFTLKNSNTKTQGITKINIAHQSNDKAKVKIWASCSPNDCYWGNFSTKKNASYQENLQRTKKNWIPQYNTFTIKKSHVTRTIKIYKHRSNDMYRVTVSNNYKSSKKKDTKNTYYMK